MADSASARTTETDSKGRRPFLDGALALVSSVQGAGFIAVAGWLALFWSLVLRARLTLGYWPHPTSGNPLVGEYRPSPLDPKTFDTHYTMVLSWGAVAAVLVPVTLLLIAASVPSRELRQPAVVVSAFFIATALAACTILLDPIHHFGEWFID